MTALEYVIPHGEFYNCDYDSYCWVEKEDLSLFESNNLLFHSRHDLLKAFTADLNGAYLMDKDTRDKLDAIEITFDEETTDWISRESCPYYRIRGQKITAEQAAEIIDSVNYPPLAYDENSHEKLCLENIEHLVKSDGTVGINSTSTTYPDINTVIQDVLQLKIRFPYLDFVMAISWWDEFSFEVWANGLRENEYINGKLYEYEDFIKCLDLGIWVHDNKIEILNSKHASKKYKEYDKLYSDTDLRKYITGSDGMPLWTP